MKKKFLVLISALLLTFSIGTVNAKGVVEADDSLNLKGTYESSKFVFGNDIQSSADIDGIGLIAGNSITTNGTVSYGLFAGNSLYINDVVEKDLFVAGNSINIGSSAVLSRDVYLAGNSVKINTTVGRNLRVTASSVDLKGVTINGNVYIAAESIELDGETVITGKLKYNENAEVTGLEEATIEKTETYEETEYVSEVTLVDYFVSFVYRIVTLFIVVVILFSLFPKTKDMIDKFKVDAGTIGRRGLTGLVCLLLIPIIAIITIFSVILLPISMIALALYCISVYIATPIVSYIIGKEIMEKLFKKKVHYLYYVLFGIFVVELVELIPFIGGWIAFVIMLVGLGIIFNLFKNKEA